MNLVFQPEAVPLWMDERGDIRVGNSRVLLDVLLSFHSQGMSPEEIAAGYPALSLADVYGVLAYYHRHKEEVEAYLRRRDQEAEELRRRIEAAQGPLPEPLQARMAAFKARKDAGHAPPPV
jgi:uncharacterized protein (DUF433 family)